MGRPDGGAARRRRRAALSINRYFLEHPEMVLGRHARTSSPFGPAYSCLPNAQEDIEELLDSALRRLPAGIQKPPSEQTPALLPIEPNVQVGTTAEGAAIKEGSYVLENNALFQIIDGTPVPVAVRSGKGTDGIPAKHARIIRHLVPIRDALRDVLRAQESNDPWGPAQVRLRVAYASFVRNFGPINLTTLSETVDPETGETRQTQRRPTLDPFADDPDVWLVASIEDYDLETGKAKQGPVFSERVLHPPVTPIIESAADALAVALHEAGHVDLDRIAELLGRSRDETIAELATAFFLIPSSQSKASKTGKPPTPISPGLSAPNSPPPSPPRRSMHAISATSKPFARSSPKI